MALHNKDGSQARRVEMNCWAVGCGCFRCQQNTLQSVRSCQCKEIDRGDEAFWAFWGLCYSDCLCSWFKLRNGDHAIVTRLVAWAPMRWKLLRDLAMESGHCCLIEVRGCGDVKRTSRWGPSTGLTSSFRSSKVVFSVRKWCSVTRPRTWFPSTVNTCFEFYLFIYY